MYIWTTLSCLVVFFPREIKKHGPASLADMAVTNLHVGFLDVSLKLLGVSHV